MGEWCDDLAKRYPWTGEALRSVPGPMCPKIDAALKNERGSCWSRPTDLPRRRPRMVDLEGGGHGYSDGDFDEVWSTAEDAIAERDRAREGLEDARRACERLRMALEDVLKLADEAISEVCDG